MNFLVYCGMLIVQYLVLSVGDIAAVPATDNVITKPQCMQDGGYCQNSWDCCSDRCLSFSYKCVKGPPTDIYKPYAPSFAVDTTHISVANLEELINRFGSDDNDEKPTVKPLASPTTTSPVSSTSISTSSSAINASAGCAGIGYECADSSQCCSNDCLHYENVHICITKRTPTTTTTTTVSPDGQCQRVGQKCYRNDECCTERCHGYLHQCVT